MLDVSVIRCPSRVVGGEEGSPKSATEDGYEERSGDEEGDLDTEWEIGRVADAHSAPRSSIA